MKIRIDTPIAKLTADLSEEQVAEILGIALDYAIGLDSSTSSKPQTTTPVVATPPAPPVPVQNKVIKHLEPSTKLEYRGFLYLKCEMCGKFKGFMPKTPISTYRCDCGHVTTLRDMRVMRVDCKCGQKFRYLTNAKDNILSIDCINCGSPVDLEYHERKQEFTTI